MWNGMKVIDADAHMHEPKAVLKRVYKACDDDRIGALQTARGLVVPDMPPMAMSPEISAARTSALSR